MSSFSKYKERLHGGCSVGEARMRQAHSIMEWTWDGDIQSQVAYQFDMYHDSNLCQLNDIEPTRDMVPLDIKFVKHMSQTLAKDQVSFHLQMKPHQECNVDYYKMYEDMYEMRWPLGLYLLVKDSEGRYNRWLVVAEADLNDSLFPTWELLRCDYVYQYVLDGKKWNVPGVRLSQNSYNKKNVALCRDA